jgi:hypothetical protein
MEGPILKSNLVVRLIRTVDESTKLINMTMLHATKAKTARLTGSGAVYFLKRSGRPVFVLLMILAQEY